MVICSVVEPPKFDYLLWITVPVLILKEQSHKIFDIRFFNQPTVSDPIRSSVAYPEHFGTDLDPRILLSLKFLKYLYRRYPTV